MGLVAHFESQVQIKQFFHNGNHQFTGTSSDTQHLLAINHLKTSQTSPRTLFKHHNLSSYLGSSFQTKLKKYAPPAIQRDHNSGAIRANRIKSAVNTSIKGFENVHRMIPGCMQSDLRKRLNDWIFRIFSGDSVNPTRKRRSLAITPN